MNHVPYKTKHPQYLRCAGFGGHKLKNKHMAACHYTHPLAAITEIPKSWETQESVVTAGLRN